MLEETIEKVLRNRELLIPEANKLGIDLNIVFKGGVPATSKLSSIIPQVQTIPACVVWPDVNTLKIDRKFYGDIKRYHNLWYRVQDTLSQITKEPRSSNLYKSLCPGVYSARVGDFFRIIYTVEREEIVIRFFGPHDKYEKAIEKFCR